MYAPGGEDFNESYMQRIYAQGVQRELAYHLFCPRAKGVPAYPCGGKKKKRRGNHKCENTEAVINFPQRLPFPKRDAVAEKHIAGKG